MWVFTVQNTDWYFTEWCNCVFKQEELSLSDIFCTSYLNTRRTFFHKQLPCAHYVHLTHTQTQGSTTTHLLADSSGPRDRLPSWCRRPRCSFYLQSDTQHDTQPNVHEEEWIKWMYTPTETHTHTRTHSHLFTSEIKTCDMHKAWHCTDSQTGKTYITVQAISMYNVLSILYTDLL